MTCILGAVRSTTTPIHLPYKFRTRCEIRFTLVMKPSWTNNLVINGDFLTSSMSPRAEVLKAYTYLVEVGKLTPEGNLYLLAGNHDLSAKAGRVSSFEFLCKILKSHFPEGSLRPDGGSNPPVRQGLGTAHVQNPRLFHMEGFSTTLTPCSCTAISTTIFRLSQTTASTCQPVGG